MRRKCPIVPPGAVFRACPGANGLSRSRPPGRARPPQGVRDMPSRRGAPPPFRPSGCSRRTSRQGPALAWQRSRRVQILRSAAIHSLGWPPPAIFRLFDPFSRQGRQKGDGAAGENFAPANPYGQQVPPPPPRRLQPRRLPVPFAGHAADVRRAHARSLDGAPFGVFKVPAHVLALPRALALCPALGGAVRALAAGCQPLAAHAARGRGRRRGSGPRRPCRLVRRSAALAGAGAAPAAPLRAGPGAAQAPLFAACVRAVLYAAARRLKAAPALPAPQAVRPGHLAVGPGHALWAVFRRAAAARLECAAAQAAGDGRFRHRRGAAAGGLL